MTSTFTRSDSEHGVSTPTSPPGMAARDIGPDLESRRAPASFPGSAGAEPSTGQGQSVPDLPRCALWLGVDGALRDVARDHATAAGLELLDAPEAPTVDAAVVLTDIETLHRGAALRAPGTPLLVLAPEGVVDAAVWRLALDRGARALLQLPAESDLLLQHLARTAAPQRRALIIAVAGGCGGAGASTLAARLAGAARRHGEVVLVDADPLGGGLDLLVEAPQSSGICWQDIAGVDTSDGGPLRAALPVVDEVGLLVAGDSTGPDPANLLRALQAMEPGGGTVVVDLAASLVTTALPLLDQLLVVVPGTDLAVRSAARRLRSWSPPPGTAGVAARRRGPLSARDVASDLGLPLWMSFRDDAAGVVPLLDVRRRGADAECRRLLAHLTGAQRTGEQIR